MLKVSPARRTHILDGDLTGGGHSPRTGLPGKSHFPHRLSDDEIIAGIEPIANDPTRYPGGVLPTGGRHRIIGSIRGVRRRVVVDFDAVEIVTGYPV